MTTATTPYVGISLEGGLLPASLLERLAAGSRDLDGSRPADYHLAISEGIGDAASRKWLYLRGVYLSFRDRLAMLGESDSGTTETRQNWLLILLAELGFGQVPYQRGGFTVGEKTYPVSHVWEHVREHVPIHLVGWNTDLDRRSGYGETGRAPQSMLQEFLNVSDEHLWGILSNGKRLRLLRDSSALVGSSYVEFDLEAIFDGELYSDFLLLFLLVHESRFELQPRDDDTPPTQADSWLERWRVDENKTGVRARERLKFAVRDAMAELGTGFLEANPNLRHQVATGALTLQDLRHELLRLTYQIVFLCVAEDRGALHDPMAAPESVENYQRYFSTTRLRRIAQQRLGDRNTDLWRTLVVVLNALGTEGGASELGLPELGGLFFRGDSLLAEDGGPFLLEDGGQLLLECEEPDPGPLHGAELRNNRLLAAIRHLDETTDDQGRKYRVDYQHLGADELGGIYESLLEYEPQHDPAGPRFWLEQLKGNARKTTGTYYTPSTLIETILDSTLEPLIVDAVRSRVPTNLLRLKVCDPTCGSGDFLVAAARRIATRYAAMWTGDEEPTPSAVADAMHDVVRHCVYGVDLSELAVEITKISLWLESLTPGKPLAFLDGHIKVGNSLLGVTPRLLEAGIPDSAFKTIEGDSSKVVASLRKQNEKERGGQGSIFEVSEVIRVDTVRLANRARKLASRPVTTLADTREQAREYREFEADPELRHRKQVANAWCAAFVSRKHADAPEAITTELLRRLDNGEPLAPDVEDELTRLSLRYQFFHWHLEFLDIFRVEDNEASDHNPDTGWQGGFDCVIGNPPWEKIELKEQEFFAGRRDEIADAASAVRKELIEGLATSEDPADRDLFRDFQINLRASAGESHILRDSERYPLTGRGRINTYAVFAETARAIVSPLGRCGLVLPTGIATDAMTAPFFGDLVRKSALVSLFEFENEAYLLSRAVHHSFRFCLLSVCGARGKVDKAGFAFGIRYIADLEDRKFTMRPEDLLLVNPNTGTSPLFRSQRDAEITFGVYNRVPVLLRDMPRQDPWRISFMQGLFNMSSDAKLFRTKENLVDAGWRLNGNIFLKDGKRMLPLYEAKMIHYYDHRYGTYEGQTEAQANAGILPRPTLDEKADPAYATVSRYWVQEWSVKNEEKSKPGKPVYGQEGIATQLESKRWKHGWLIGWRDIARSSDERTLIAAILPRVGAGHTLPLAFPGGDAALLCANFSSFVLDYIARQKIAGTHLTYGYMNQLPVLPPARYEEFPRWAPDIPISEWVLSRVLELTYTSWDMEPFARDLGDDEPPFVWDEHRRFKLRAELDAAFFHLYEINRGDVDHIMDTFSVVKRRDKERYDGDYRTKSTILRIYDAMAEATRTGVPYTSALDPVPGDGLRHRARKPSEAR